MNKKEHLLTILSEECAEIIKDVSKTLRFGVNDHYPGICKPTNIESVYHEYNDLIAVVEMLNNEGVMPCNVDKLLIQAKKDKVNKFLEYSRDMGTLTD
jgi:hypothetical protein